jgi:hypothetical protein
MGVTVKRGDSADVQALMQSERAQGTHEEPLAASEWKMCTTDIGE